MRFHQNTLGMALVAATVCFTAPNPGSATPLSPPYLEIEYDLAGSEVTLDTPVGPGVATVGPGTLVVQVEDVLAVSDARLASFDLTLNFDAFSVLFDLQMSMGGDAEGTFDPSTQQIVWSTPADAWSTSGTITCSAGAFLCGILGLPDGIPVNVNDLGDEAVGDLQFTGGTQAGLEMQWLTTVESFELTSPVELTMSIIGAETSRTLVTAPGSVPSKCDALKKKFVGKKVFCKMKVFAKAAKMAVPDPDKDKLLKCDTKFIEMCEKAETNKGDCTITGNCAGLGLSADAAAGGLDADVLTLMP